MTNRIDGPGVSQASNAARAQGPGARTETRQDAGPATVGAADQVNFTRDGLQMQQLAEQVSATDSIDYEKVSAIKQALANGSYSVNAEAIAESIMGMEKGLSK